MTCKEVRGGFLFKTSESRRESPEEDVMDAKPNKAEQEVGCSAMLGRLGREDL